MNYIDTRDLAKRKDELEDLKTAIDTAKDDLDGAGYPLGTPRDQIKEDDWHLIEALNEAIEKFGEDEKAELDELETLESEISEWRHGETMIPESEFEGYARQFAEDIGAIPDDAQWPCTCIDWEQAARELAMDYSTVTYQGTDYLVRS